MRHALCEVGEIPNEGTRIVPFFGREVHVYLTNGAPRAAMSVCQHLGGPLECADGKLVCPWHGAEFAMADGRRLKSPAPPNSRLMFLPTRTADGVLYYVWGE
jgi:nitrite reductase/ring-hydroxylating ferredoxin subunit